MNWDKAVNKLVPSNLKASIKFVLLLCLAHTNPVCEHFVPIVFGEQCNVYVTVFFSLVVTIFLSFLFLKYCTPSVIDKNIAEELLIIFLMIVCGMVAFGYRG